MSWNNANKNLADYTRQLTERSELAETPKTQLDTLSETNEVKRIAALQSHSKVLQRGDLNR